MTSRPQNNDRVALSVACYEQLTESLCRFDTVMSVHLRVYEEAIREFVTARRVSEAAFAESLRLSILTRINSWILGLDSSNAVLALSPWMYDWLYPQPVEEAQGVNREFVVTSTDELFKDDRGKWTRTCVVLAVSGDAAMHVAAAEIAGDPKKYPNGDAYHKEYMRARRTLTVGVLRPDAAARATSLPADGGVSVPTMDGKM